MQIKISFVFIFLLLAQTIPAQPGTCVDAGWKGEYCRQELNGLLQKYGSEIKNLDQEIASDPQNADLYYRRGKIYSTMMFEKRLGLENVEFDGVTYFSAIDKKAIDDYTQAINLSPKSEYFNERGAVYESYWQKEIKQSLGGIGGSKINGDKKSREKILKIADELFLKNQNFDKAHSDFQKGLKLSSADDESGLSSRRKLFFIHSARAYHLSDVMGDFSAVIGNEKAADFVLADQDYVIDLYKYVYLRPQKFRYTESIYESVLQKGEMARNFGRDDLALQIFDEAEKYWSVNSLNCLTNTNRAEIFLKQNNIEEALRELTTALDSGNLNCRSIVEFRGDVYFRQRDWQAAIKDYTAFLNTEHGKTSQKTYIKRGKAYLTLGEAEKAVADFDYVINKLFYKSCPQYFQMRAAAYKMLGKTDLAATDEKTASELPKNADQSGCQINE